MTKIHNKKLFIILTAIIIVIAGAVSAYALFWPKDYVRDGVNYAPPTTDEKQSADAQKDKNIDREETDKTPASPSGRTINLVLTDANQYNDVIEVRAYTRDAYEDDGTCTVTFTKGAASFTSQSQAFADATTTQCGALDTPRSKFSEAGSWAFELVYSSPSSKGTVSGTVEVK